MGFRICSHDCLFHMEMFRWGIQYKYSFLSKPSLESVLNVASLLPTSQCLVTLKNSIQENRIAGLTISGVKTLLIYLRYWQTARENDNAKQKNKKKKKKKKKKTKQKKKHTNKQTTTKKNIKRMNDSLRNYLFSRDNPRNLIVRQPVVVDVKMELSCRVII